MYQNRVAAVGFVLMTGEETGRGLSLKTWTRLAGQPGSFTDEYHDLTYLEALQVIESHCDSNRPGWELGDGWRQPPLFA